MRSTTNWEIAQTGQSRRPKPLPPHPYCKLAHPSSHQFSPDLRRTPERFFARINSATQPSIVLPRPPRPFAARRPSPMHLQPSSFNKPHTSKTRRLCTIYIRHFNDESLDQIRPQTVNFQIDKEISRSNCYWSEKYLSNLSLEAEIV